MMRDRKVNGVNKLVEELNGYDRLIRYISILWVYAFVGLLFTCMLIVGFLIFWLFGLIKF